MARAFRSQESYTAERTTREMLVTFLEDRGFTQIEDQRQNFGETQSQLVRAIDNTGAQVGLWVRLCWRKEQVSDAEAYSAAQLLARVQDGDWEGTIRDKVERERARGAIVGRDSHEQVERVTDRPHWSEARDPKPMPLTNCAGIAGMAIPCIAGAGRTTCPYRGTTRRTELAGRWDNV